jgi:predicted negative regulator of RcsB-dependent stress response
MAIRKKESYKAILLLAICCLVTRIWGAADKLRARPAYDAAMKDFNAAKLDEAKKRFAAILDFPDCSPLVRLCSLNMVAQIDRIQGRNEEALKTFETLASYIEESERQGGAAVELWHSAVFSRAEIYESLCDPNSAIEQYTRILTPPFKTQHEKPHPHQTPAKDRIRRLISPQPDFEDDTLILNYKRAWQLDAVGKKEEAAKAFSDIASADLKESGQCKMKIAETVCEYAKIQAAIILGETGEYRQALLTLGRADQTPDDPHIAELTKNVRDGIETLRREVNPVDR